MEKTAAELSLTEMRRNIYAKLYEKTCERLERGPDENLEREINFLQNFVHCINFSVERETMEE